jgi:hypothetical protein
MIGGGGGGGGRFTFDLNTLGPTPPISTSVGTLPGDFAPSSENLTPLQAALIGLYLAFHGNMREATAAEAALPSRIYSARVLVRSAQESGPFHNFPESFNRQIFNLGTRTVTPNYFNLARPGLSNNGVLYQLPGSVNGTNGMFEIGVRPSASGNTEVIMHRFFDPNP